LKKKFSKMKFEVCFWFCLAKRACKNIETTILDDTNSRSAEKHKKITPRIALLISPESFWAVK
jgi:hypothetical protein